MTAWVAGCLGALAVIGLLFARRRQTTEDFFLGGRRIPAWAVVLSFLATEISAMTVIGVPAVSFRENWQYLQFFIGSAGARLAIAFLFIPAFYRYDCTTIYEFLRHRFGPLTQYAASALFLVTRLLASGVRLMAACVAVAVFLDWPIVPVIALFTAASMLYIAAGGIRAVVWGNVLQALTFLGAGAATAVFLIGHVDGGLPEILRLAGAAGRLDLFQWTPAPGPGGALRRFFSDPNLFWIAVLNGFFGSMAAFGTDHELMQRLLTAKTREASQKAMLWTTAASLGALVLFLSVGTGLFAYYDLHPELALPAHPDKIYPHFAVQVLPPALAGLVLAAVLMASIDSPLASLSASFVTDLYRPLIRRRASERHYMAVSRLAVAVFALALGWIAYAFSSYQGMLWLAFKIGGVTYGSLLGAFLYGLLTRRHADRANVVAMATMALVNLALLVLSEKGVLPLGWSWLLLLGTFGTMGLARLLGPLLDGEPTSGAPDAPR